MIERGYVGLLLVVMVLMLSVETVCADVIVDPTRAIESEEETDSGLFLLVTGAFTGIIALASLSVLLGIKKKKAV
jgi:hypothetical protein